MINNKLKEIFTGLLGEGIELKSTTGVNPDEIDKIGKEIFVLVVEKWRNAFKIKNALGLKYEINFDGYDNNLFIALENLLLFSIGYVKSQIVMNYIYGELVSEEVKFQVTDKNNKTYYISNASELYDLINNINDDDFLIENK